MEVVKRGFSKSRNNGRNKAEAQRSQICIKIEKRMRAEFFVFLFFFLIRSKLVG